MWHVPQLPRRDLSRSLLPRTPPQTHAVAGPLLQARYALLSLFVCARMTRVSAELRKRGSQRSGLYGHAHYNHPGCKQHVRTHLHERVGRAVRQLCAVHQHLHACDALHFRRRGVRQRIRAGRACRGCGRVGDVNACTVGKESRDGRNSWALKRSFVCNNRASRDKHSTSRSHVQRTLYPTCETCERTGSTHVAATHLHSAPPQPTIPAPAHAGSRPPH